MRIRPVIRCQPGGTELTGIPAVQAFDTPLDVLRVDLHIASARPAVQRFLCDTVLLFLAVSAGEEDHDRAHHDKLLTSNRDVVTIYSVD